MQVYFISPLFCLKYFFDGKGVAIYEFPERTLEVGRFFVELVHIFSDYFRFHPNLEFMNLHEYALIFRKEEI